MKIIQLIQRPQLRGAEVFACQLSHELIRSGHDVIVVTVFDGNVELPFEGRIISLNGAASNRLWDYKAWRTLARIVKEENADVIQANAGDTLKYAVLSKLFFGWKTPLIFRNASTISLYLKSSFARRWNALLLKSVDHVISVSQFSASDFTRTFPSLKERITVVPIGVTDPDFNKQAMPSPANPFFLHIGGFTFEKNHAGLIRIFKQLKLKFPQSALGLVGDGKLKNDIELLVKKEGLEGSILFFGYREDPSLYLRAADCFLLPSIIEGMPSVILEAFLCKIPVVAYSVGGIPEIVQRDQTGWLVPPGDENDFVNAVTDALSNAEKARRFSAQAVELAKGNFTLENIAQRFIGVYERVV